MQQYRIPFTGLKLGKHYFELEAGEAFFEEFEYSLVKDARLKVDLEMDKQETMLILQFHIAGEIFLNCDVCLAKFPSVVDIRERQIVKFKGDGLAQDTEEILVLDKNEHEIDVSKLIYEYINLAVPFVNSCGDIGNTQWCDKETIGKLNEFSSKKQKNEGADPRWEALKNIKNN